MNIYEAMWNARKKSLADKIIKAPNYNAAAREVEELAQMTEQEVLAAVKEAAAAPEKTAGLCAVHITGENERQFCGDMEKAYAAFRELAEAAAPMLEYLNRHYDPHTAAVITEGRVTVVRDEISAPLPVRD